MSGNLPPGVTDEMIDQLRDDPPPFCRECDDAGCLACDEELRDTPEFRPSDLDFDELERVAGECDVTAAIFARWGGYDRANDLSLAAKIIRKYAEDREGLSEKAEIFPASLSAGPAEGAPLWPMLIRERLGRLFTRSIAVDDSGRVRRAGS